MNLNIPSLTYFRPLHREGILTTVESLVMTPMVNQCDRPSEPRIDFLEVLDEKLRRRNGRLEGKMVAWGEMLDVAGWCVAINNLGGRFWLSGRAKRDLQRRGGVLNTWADLLAAVRGVDTELALQMEEGVVVWSAPAPAEVGPVPAANLTRREVEIMSWMRDGKTSNEIAIIIGRSIRTIEKHQANLYRKLGVGNRESVILEPFPPVT